MSSVNKVTILGHLGRDPESRSFQNGGKVVNLRVATSEVFKDREGNRQERTEWHSVAIFNEKLAEIAERFLRKGSKVYLEGKLETRKWQDQSGQDRFTTEIVLRQFGGQIVLLDGKGSEAPSEPRQAVSASSAPAGGSGYQPRTRTPGEYPEPQGARGGGRAPVLDDDIPFSAEVR